MVAILVVPGFALLYWLHQRGMLIEATSPSHLRAAIARQQEPDDADTTPGAPR
jgi:hypothetical protein